MAFTIFSYPDANTFVTIPAGSPQIIVVPPTLVAAYEDFEFEFLFPSVTPAHAGTTVNIFPTLTTAATGSDNWFGLGDPVEIPATTGDLAFIRDIYGLISRQTSVHIMATADIQMRLTVLGVS